MKQKYQGNKVERNEESHAAKEKEKERGERWGRQVQQKLSLNLSISDYNNNLHMNKKICIKCQQSRRDHLVLKTMAACEEND